MAARSIFLGEGIQNSGSGDFHARDIYIGRAATDQLLADLCVTDPSLDKSRIEGTKGGLFLDSYRWILDHPDFLQWHRDPLSRLLWIRGDPGKGKTMLLCGIINELNKMSPQATPAAYFFCQATDDRINSATAVVRGLLYMLFCQFPALTSHLAEMHRHRGKSLFEDVNAWTALSSAFTQILADPVLEGKVLVIDALDECLTNCPQLLQLIAQVLPTSRVKWIVSSRNWPQIEEILGTIQTKLTLRLELNEASVSHAVREYIRYRVNALVDLKSYDDQTRWTLQKRLVEKSNNTFLWVALVCDQLHTIELWDVEDVMEEIPSGLEELYGRMLQQVLQLPNREVYRSVLSTVTTAFRPLRLVELAHIASLPSNIPRTAASVARIVGRCGSLLTIKDETVYTIHQSAKDFLGSNPEIFSHGMGTAHHAIFARSLGVLTSHLMRDIYCLGAPGVLIDEVTPPDPDPLAPLEYACVHWVDHLRESAVTAPGLVVPRNCGTINAFLEKKFLHWLEALSLLRSLSLAVLAVRSLEALAISAGASQLADFARDARRFVLSFRTGIEIAPLQLYLSALIFSPKESIIRRLYEDEARERISIMPAMESSWSPCLHTIEGHDGTVTSVAFAQDGRRVVSGSDDKTVKVWDTVTGALVQMLVDHNAGVTSVAFAPDGRYAASGSYDTTVKIWDTVTGECVQTLEGSADPVTSVAYAPDGRRVVSGSDDKTVKVWDTSTGECIQTLEGHVRFVTSVAYAPDGRYAASGSYDTTVKIWDTVTGECVQTLEGHDRFVTSVAYAPDGRHIVSGCDDYITIWDTATGACVQTLAGHSGTVSSAAFAPDGLRVVSGSDDRTLKIWDTATGTCVRTLRGHSSIVFSVAFAPDGLRVVSGSGDMTLKIWDTATGACVQTLAGHSGTVFSVAFAPDGLRVVSGSNDRTLKIWDTATGTCVQTLEDSDSISSVAFARDGWHIVTNRAVLRLNSPAFEVPTPPGYVQGLGDYRLPISLRFNSENTWILKDDIRLLWLPQEYRTEISAFRGSRVALGHSSGRAICIGFVEGYLQGIH